MPPTNSIPAPALPAAFAPRERAELNPNSDEQPQHLAHSITTSLPWVLGFFIDRTLERIFISMTPITDADGTPLDHYSIFLDDSDIYEHPPETSRSRRARLRSRRHRQTSRRTPPLDPVQALAPTRHLFGRPPSASLRSRSLDPVKPRVTAFGSERTHALAEFLHALHQRDPRHELDALIPELPRYTHAHRSAMAGR